MTIIEMVENDGNISIERVKDEFRKYGKFKLYNPACGWVYGNSFEELLSEVDLKKKIYFSNYTNKVTWHPFKEFCRIKAGTAEEQRYLGGIPEKSYRPSLYLVDRLERIKQESNKSEIEFKTNNSRSIQCDFSKQGWKLRVSRFFAFGHKRAT